ncbi:hypothetical protein BGZ58_006080 [Dissophora ornata]|nr:hypothetical protein BGZ58_006080 [Dissophora ornata]
MDDDHQSFQLVPINGTPIPNPVINIELGTDSATGEKFVFWEDIETFFPGLQHVHRENDIMVSFMRDRNGLRYNPKRIKYYPRTTLKVATTASSQPALMTSENGRAREIAPPEYSASCTDSPAESEQRQPTPPTPEVPAVPSYGTPRLFLILPSGDQPLSKSSPFDNKFRIHFLCEGGEQMKCRGPGNNTPDTIPGHVHLCGHKGYELDRPTEFFDRYGPYVLNMLQMLKHGFPVNGMIVPSLKDLEYARVLRESRDGLDFFTKVCGDIEADVNQMIDYLYSIKIENRKTFEEHVKAGDLDHMQHSDLTEVISFLKDRQMDENGDRERNSSLGWLFCGKSYSGQKVWLCHHHHDAAFDTIALKNLGLAMGDCRTPSQAKIGELKLILKPTKHATGVHQLTLMTQLKHTRALHVVLDWDTTYHDLCFLRDCVVGMEQLRTLTLDCRDHTGPTTDLVNRGKRGDPLAHMLMASSLQYIKLKGAEGLFTRSMAFAAVHPTRLQYVHLDALFDPKLHTSKLQTLFKMSPKLITLSLGCSKINFCGTIALVKDLLITHKHFRILNLSCPTFKIKLDRTEPGSPLLDRTRIETVPVAWEAFVLEQYGTYLHELVIDNSFKDDSMVILDRISHRPEDFKLRRIDVDVDWEAFSFSGLTPVGMRLLTSAIKRLCNPSHVPPLVPELSGSTSVSEKSIENPTVATIPFISEGSAMSSPSSPKPLSSPSLWTSPPEEPLSLPLSSQVSSPVPCKLTFRTRYGFKKWYSFASENFALLTSFELKTVDINQFIQLISTETTSIKVPDPGRHSILRTLIFRGSYSKLKEPTIEALLLIISMCPLLESFQLSRCTLSNSQWRKLFQGLNFRRLRSLNFAKSNLGLSAVEFPHDLMPEDAVLGELDVSKSYLSSPAKEVLVCHIKRKLPGCKVAV